MTLEISLLTAAALAAWACSTSIFSYVLLIQPLLDAPLHGMRGLKRARARRTRSGFSQLEPLMRWLAARIHPLMSERKRQALARQIMLAGEVWGLWPAEMQALSLLGAALGAAYGCMWVACYDGTGLYVLMLALLGALVPGMQLASTGQKRVRAISRRVPHVVDLLVLSLGAGLDFSASLRQVVERAADPESDVIEELGIVLEELKLGHTRQNALKRLAERAPCDEVRDLVAATIQAEEQGTPLGVVLQTQATTSRQRRSTRAEEAASRASTAMIVPLALVFVSLMILIIGPTVLAAIEQSSGFGGF